MKPLEGLRNPLLDLHRALLESERAPGQSPAEFLQALIGDPQLEWLKPLTTLVSSLDELLDDRSSSGATARRCSAVRSSPSRTASSRPGSRLRHGFPRDGQALAHERLAFDRVFDLVGEQVIELRFAARLCRRATHQHPRHGADVLRER